MSEEFAARVAAQLYDVVTSGSATWDEYRHSDLRYRGFLLHDLDGAAVEVTVTPVLDEVSPQIPVSTACPHCGQEPPAHTLNCPDQRAFG